MYEVVLKGVVDLVGVIGSYFSTNRMMKVLHAVSDDAWLFEIFIYLSFAVSPPLYPISYFDHIIEGATCINRQPFLKGRYKCGSIYWILRVSNRYLLTALRKLT